MMSRDVWDQIYTVNKYYDGPELGIADYRGKPHIYERQFDGERDDYSERFLLSPIDPELLSLVLENWEIWLRWDSAYRQGNATIKSHPALPEDRQRHEEFSKLIGDRLKVDGEHGFSKWARFNSGKVQWVDSPTEAPKAQSTKSTSLPELTGSIAVPAPIFRKQTGRDVAVKR
jgi:hypothetical protein